MMRIGIIGGTGYVGGELLRLLLLHPQVEVTMVTSRQSAGEYIFNVHPNLRGLTQLKFVPHGHSGTPKELRPSLHSNPTRRQRKPRSQTAWRQD